MLTQLDPLHVFVFQVFQLGHSCITNLKEVIQEHSCHHELKGGDTGDLKFLRVRDQLSCRNHLLSFNMCQ